MRAVTYPDFKPPDSASLRPMSPMPGVCVCGGGHLQGILRFNHLSQPSFRPSLGLPPTPRCHTPGNSLGRPLTPPLRVLKWLAERCSKNYNADFASTHESLAEVRATSGEDPCSEETHFLSEPWRFSFLLRHSLGWTERVLLSLSSPLRTWVPFWCQGHQSR